MNKIGRLKKIERRESCSVFSGHPCLKPFLSAVVRMNEEVTSCCVTQGSDENIKDKRLREIWTGEYFKNFRGSFRKNNLFGECARCIESNKKGARTLDLV